MRTTSDNLKCLVFFLVIVLACDCVSINGGVKTKVRRKNDDVRGNNLPNKNGAVFNETSRNEKRGFFSHGGLLTLGKVLNFFPVGGERECQPSGYTVARAGICLNPYDCRQRDGKASGDCAHGLGVCCVFEVTCGGSAQNNLTYFMSPGFPELWSREDNCTITIEKAFAGITQLRIDFVHFTIGQPNRMTGECDEDAMVLGEDDNKFTLCGQNHGQHIYYTLPSGSESREADELPGARGTALRVRTRGVDAPRLWLMRIAQMPLAHAAPHGCLQYFTESNGTIKTFNFATNGRHLAAHEYRACVRRAVGRCAVRYAPCDGRSFRIGPAYDEPAQTVLAAGPGESGGAGTGFYGPDGAFITVPAASTTISVTTTTPTTTTAATTTVAVEEQLVQPANETMQQQPMPVDSTQVQDEVEGSGADPQVATPIESAPEPSMLSRIWSFIWPTWIWGQSGRLRDTWSPYAQHYATTGEPLRYFGYGGFGGVSGFGGYGTPLRRYAGRRCRDRVTIPCENEYFVSSLPYGPGVCEPHHCGNSFCPDALYPHCRVESSITPFAVSFHFGPPTLKPSPEENIGACLRYTQLPCDS